jgi:hypothetical protein
MLYLRFDYLIALVHSHPIERYVTDPMQIFISYRHFSDPLIPFAIALFIQSDLNHRKPFSQPISQVLFDRPLSIALDLKSRLTVLIQFLRVSSPFWSYSQHLKPILIVELRDMYPFMGLFGEVNGSNYASDHLDVQSLIELETIRIRQWHGLRLNGVNS